jgi:hypothetical protein
LTWLCEWHGLTSLVLESLGKLALMPRVSRITLERMKALSRASGRLNRELLSTARSISFGISDEGAETLLMNGCVFPLAIYPTADIRPVERIDLLVRERDWRKVIAVCQKAGYLLSDRDPQFDDGSEALLYYQYFSPCILENEKGDRIHLRFRVFDMGKPDEHEVAWRNAQAIDADDGPRRVSREDQLIQSCITFNMSYFGKLLHAVDIGLLVTRYGGDLNWDYVEERLRSKSLYPSFYFTLSQVVRWLKLEDVSVALTHPGQIRRKIYEIYWQPNQISFSARRPTHFHRLRFYLLESGGWTDKLQMIFRLASPKTQWVSDFFGRPCRPWLKLKFVFLALRSRVGVRLT